jgi:hypothetical protein
MLAPTLALSMPAMLYHTSVLPPLPLSGPCATAHATRAFYSNIPEIEAHAISSAAKT